MGEEYLGMPVRSRAIPRRSRKPAQKAARGDKVSRARAKTIKKIAKSTVMSVKEKKYTQFEQVSTTTWQITRGDQFTVLRLTNVAAIFPPQGDNVHQRDGLKYRMLGFNVFFSTLTDRNNINSPLEVRVVRIHPRLNVRSGADTDGVEDVDFYYPQSESSDLVTWTRGVPVVVGNFDSNKGRVVKSFRIRPDTRVIAGNNLYHMATPTDIYNGIEYKYHKLWIPHEMTVTADSGSSEIPANLPKYCLLFRCGQQNNTAWDVSQIYTQCVFKDL